MNAFIKGLLTGVFGVVVGLLITGSKNQNLDGIGYFQLSTTMDSNGFYVYETILDTQNNRIVSRKRVDYELYEKIEK